MKKLKYIILLIGFTLTITTLLHSNCYGFQKSPRPSNDDHSPSLSPDDSLIVFHTFRNGYSDIYVMNTDGSKQRRLTTAETHDQNPKWSPDGEKILFQTEKEGVWQIISMDSDGNGKQTLSSPENHATNPSWSPDGSIILYQSNDQIWQMASDGSENVQITTSPGIKSNPSFSPDGKKIVFTSDSSGSTEIYTINADRSGEEKLTDITSVKGIKFITGLGWMPLGDRIWFTSNVGKTGILYWNPTIHSMNPDGSDLRIMFDDLMQYFYPVWSKDSKTIYVDTYLYGGREIISVNADGTNVRNLTRTSSHNFYPKWADNGEKIVFTSQRDGDMEIYIMNKDGSNPINLTKSKYREGRPAVSKDGEKIVFVSYRTSTHGNLYTFDLDGKNLQQITKDRDFQKLKLFPINTIFSADGTKIIFELAPVWDGKRWDLYSIDLDGKNFKQLTNTTDGRISQYPQVSKDGKFITYQTNIDGNWEIYRIDMDGSNPINLTNNDYSNDIEPVWSREEAKIIFRSTRENGSNLYQMNNDGTVVEYYSKDISGSFHTTSPDGTKILYSKRYNHNTEIFIMDINGENDKCLTK